MNFNDKCQVEVVRPIIIMNGQVTAALSRRDRDKVGMANEVRPAINKVHAERAERGRVHRFSDLSNGGHDAAR